MKYPVIIVMVVLFLASAIMPAYANTRAENNKNIADFVLDTIKLPLVLVGAFVNMDHGKAKAETDYKGHEGLKKCLK